MKNRNNHQGFTLMELLITVSIIAILISIGIASYSTINKQSRDTKRKSDLEQVRSALEMYRADNGYYPSVGAGTWVETSTGLTSSLVTIYLPVIPSDPRRTATYMYLATTASGGNYYGYCLSAGLESENPTDTCTPYTGQTYGIKNP